VPIFAHGGECSSWEKSGHTHGIFKFNQQNRNPLAGTAQANFYGSEKQMICWSFGSLRAMVAMYETEVKGRGGIRPLSSVWRRPEGTSPKAWMTRGNVF